MRIDAPLPPILPEGSSMSGRISSFSSSLDNRMQVAFEMPVPATAAVETETQGHEPGGCGARSNGGKTMQPIGSRDARATRMASAAPARQRMRNS